MKKTTRKLSLSKQSVKNLANEDLTLAAGGAQTQYFSACQTNCRASACVCPFTVVDC